MPMYTYSTTGSKRLRPFNSLGWFLVHLISMKSTADLDSIYNLVLLCPESIQVSCTLHSDDSSAELCRKRKTGLINAELNNENNKQ
jgi:hypothetical protein